MNKATIGATRYEIKLIADFDGLDTVLSWIRLHTEGFSSSFPKRRVNNIYFDTPDYENLEANLAGISERRKLRFRWYGDTHVIERGAWELKSKKAGLGSKVTQPVPHTISLMDGITWEQVMTLLRSGLSDKIAEALVEAFIPTLINHYERHYFVSSDGAVRATVDYNQEFYDQTLSPRPNLTRRTQHLDSIVLELKATPEHYDRISDALQRFPLRVVRNSKYVTGMLRSGLI